jgi:hypothetical protein
MLAAAGGHVALAGILQQEESKQRADALEQAQREAENGDIAIIRERFEEAMGHFESAAAKFRYAGRLEDAKKMDVSFTEAKKMRLMRPDVVRVRMDVS